MARGKRRRDTPKKEYRELDYELLKISAPRREINAGLNTKFEAPVVKPMTRRNSGFVETVLWRLNPAPTTWLPGMFIEVSKLADISTITAGECFKGGWIE